MFSIKWPRMLTSRTDVSSQAEGSSVCIGDCILMQRSRSVVLFAIMFILAILTVGESAYAQNLFVSDQNNIYEYTPSGVRSTFATIFETSGPVGASALLMSLASDNHGNLYAGDIVTGSIFKVTPNGSVSTFVDNANNSNKEPRSLACDSNGNLFVGYDGTGIIDKYTPDGTESTFATGAEGLACDSNGNLFVNGNSIYEYTPGGVQSTFAAGGSGEGLAFDRSGNLFAVYYSDSDAGIYKYTPDGTQSTFASGLTYPMKLAVDSNGNVFEVGLNSSDINEFAPDGTQSVFATGLSGFFNGLAFQPVPANVPEPGILSLLLGVGVTFASRLNRRRSY